ncbi:oxidoreductase [Burkholderia lata]|nr:oxidoreductase [Burkholderia lata]VWD64520.1 oxidoreductase [Burkholderia lata]
MKFGVSFLPDTGPADRPAADYYAHALKLSALADRLGYTYVKMTEHYLKPYGGYSPSPLMFLAAAAAQTESIRLMTGGIQASFHHPIQLAAEAAQLDAISNGRLELGFARAFLPYEFDAFGIDLDSSKTRFQQTIDATVRLLTEESVSEDTPFFRYRDAQSLPRPTQQPRPPVWVAALLTPSSFEWIGERGFNLLMAAPPRKAALAKTQEMVALYRETFERHHGHTGRRPQVAISIPLMIGTSDAHALALAEPRLRHHWRYFAEAAKSWDQVQSPAYQGYNEAMKNKMGGMDTADLDATAVLGTPDTVRQRIRALEADLGLDAILWHIDYGAQPYELMSNNLEVFARDVLPGL